MKRSISNAPESFHRKIAYHFDSAHSNYEPAARLQQSVAWRLARQIKYCTLPKGLRLDLGAGTGFLSRAIEAHKPDQRVISIDRSMTLLGCNPNSPSIVWNLNDGPLPVNHQVSLIACSFAIQWLLHPTRHIEKWCQKLSKGGWFALALPTNDSFPQWYEAADKANVMCSALPLPKAEDLIAISADYLTELHVDRLQFTQSAKQGLDFLRQIRTIGAQSSLMDPLNPGALRKLNRFWNQGSNRAKLTWDILILVGQRI
ncbi:biotin biosynthesis protein BioC (chromatophore) [Paulinella micropora]|uniref:Biotin biosynthesis protein BioC n=1 Tax=Paulinella micropora TaxID=1928728 RepID=A0A5K7W4Z1_9EUKA|nr:biotin biosynthesis protein BioC [Paulinella micropora]